MPHKEPAPPASPSQLALEDGTASMPGEQLEPKVEKPQQLGPKLDKHAIAKPDKQNKKFGMSAITARIMAARTAVKADRRKVKALKKNIYHLDAVTTASMQGHQARAISAALQVILKKKPAAASMGVQKKPAAAGIKKKPAGAGNKKKPAATTLKANPPKHVSITSHVQHVCIQHVCSMCSMCSMCACT
jgi:hypothetical protein